MTENIILSSNHKYNNIGGFCPKCHHYEPIGDVEVSANIKFRPDASSENIHIHHLGLMNMDIDLGGIPYISIICPECGTQMIQIDDQMSFATMVMNSIGFFTKASCDGDESYSRGYIMLYDLQSLIELINRTDKFNRTTFEYEGSTHTVFKYVGGSHPLDMLLFDEKLNCIRPLTLDVVKYLQNRHSPKFLTNRVCELQGDFVKALNGVCKELEGWKTRYSFSNRNDNMSLYEYIKYTRKNKKRG